MDRAYDRFTIELQRVQLLYSQSGKRGATLSFQLNLSDKMESSVGESWKSARTQRSSVQHILHPMDFSIQLGKCVFEKDARMPR